MSEYHQSTDINSEAERLRLMGLTANDASKTALLKIAEAGLAPGRILDVGCGAGDAFAVLKEVFPNAEITGVDQSEKAVEVAKNRGVAASVVVGNVMSLSENKDLGQFDLVYIRNTLLHIPKTTEAITQLTGVLKDKGTLFAQEPDWDKASANWDDFSVFKGAMMQAMRAHGINPTVGQDLERVFGESGLNSVERSVYEYKTRTTDEGWKVLEYLLEVSQGLITPYLQKAGIDSTQVMLEKFNTAQQNAENYFNTPAWVVVTGTKA